jgi:hypothetical protein
MHAVVVTVSISDHETAERHLKEEVVPGVSQAPGFVTGPGRERTTRESGWSSSNLRMPPRR